MSTEKTVSFCTLGCRVNQYESRSIAEQFVKNGYKTVPFGSKCDVCIVNTCAVTAESVRKSAQMIRRAASLAGSVAVMGCASELEKSLAGVAGIKLFIGTKGKSKAAYALLTGENAFDDISGFESTNIGEVDPSFLTEFSSCRAFVKIEDGCNGKCAYCVIPKLRGPVRLRPESDILAEIDRLCAFGCKEVILTGIETAAYGAHNLCELIKKTAQKDIIKRIRLGSLDPNILTDEFITTLRDTGKFMPHLHLAVQSASNNVLNSMKRPYSKEKLERLTYTLKSSVPNVMLSADIITSFPTETEDDFLQTLDYIKRYGFLHIHAFSFSPRPGTAAFEIKTGIPHDIALDRTKRLISLSNELKLGILSKKTGNTEKILIENKKNGMYTGHTEDFCDSLVKCEKELKSGDIVTGTAISVKDCMLVTESDGNI